MLFIPTKTPYETWNSIHHYEDIFEYSENLSKGVVYGSDKCSYICNYRN